MGNKSQAKRVYTVLGKKDSSDAHFTPKVADFATLPQATIFMRIHKNLAVHQKTRR